MHYAVAIFPTAYGIHPAELGRAAEDRGFESIWVAEHSHFPVCEMTPGPPQGDAPGLPRMYYDVMDPFVALSVAAAVTTRLRLATGVSLVIQRDPIHTAKAVASLDALSGGRVLFGVGPGWHTLEMANHGTRPETRLTLMRERIEAMKAIWTDERAEYHGALVHFDPLYQWPKPAQRPHPPVHVAGAFPGGLRRALRYGDGWVPLADERLLAVLPEVPRRAADAGRGEAFPVSVYYCPAEPGSAARYQAAGVARLIFMLPPDGRDQALAALDRLVGLRRELGGG
jgi:probable F420-dependent oxidoreductase